jgi:hypothetical protein
LATALAGDFTDFTGALAGAATGFAATDFFTAATGFLAGAFLATTARVFLAAGFAADLTAFATGLALAFGAGLARADAFCGLAPARGFCFVFAISELTL